MSADFQKVYVLDDTLACTNEIKYAVNQGAQNITTADFNAISESASSLTFSLQVPSENIIISREVMWSSTLVLKVVGTPAIGEYLIDYGRSESFGNFPLHASLSTIQGQINNTTVSMNVRDVLPSIVRMTDRKLLQKYSTLSPLSPDTYKSYADGVNANNNPLGGYNNIADSGLLPRGAFPVVISSALTAGGLPDPATPQVIGDGNVKTSYISISCAEPLLLSPFLFGGEQANSQGFYGIQSMTFTMNVANADRVFRSSRTGVYTVGANAGISIESFKSSKLTFMFKTPHSNLLLPSRNCVPFYELPRYISTPKQQFLTNERFTIGTNTISLNQIPDKLIILVRKPIQEQKVNDTESFFVINKVSINFNNASGLLSSSNINDLYRMSSEAGSNQSYLEFVGRASRPSASGQNPITFNTSGSHCVVDMGLHVQLSEQFYSPGSLGQFNLQIQVDATNNSGETITPEICLITMNSGVFISERGQSSLYTGLLSKSDVLEASKQEPYKRSDVKRLVGSGFLDSLRSVWSKYISPMLTASNAKKVLQMSDNEYAKKGADVLGALGYGKSGGLHNRLM